MNANVAPDRVELATSTFLSRTHQLLIGGRCNAEYVFRLK